MTHDLWIEISLPALRHNTRQVLFLIGNETGLIAVVKANGYGHGLVEPSKVFLEAGASALAVTRLDEALALRRAGITAPIMLLVPIQPSNAEAAVEAELQVTVTDLELASILSKAARKMGRVAQVHLKIDTGMGRLGALPEQATSLMVKLAAMPALNIVGVYTHFANAAEKSIAQAECQFRKFSQTLDEMRMSGLHVHIAHAANSAALLRLPQSRLDAVRVGTLLYGQYPSQHVPKTLNLMTTWKMKARVTSVREVPVGTKIGYAGEYIARRQTRTAVLPLGFADGFTLVPEGPIYRQSLPALLARRARRKLCVTIHGQDAPVIGRVAMQTIVVDVTHIAGVEVGTEAVIPVLRIPSSALVPRIYVDYDLG